MVFMKALTINDILPAWYDLEIDDHISIEADALPFSLVKIVDDFVYNIVLDCRGELGIFRLVYIFKVEDRLFKLTIPRHIQISNREPKEAVRQMILHFDLSTLVIVERIEPIK